AGANGWNSLSDLFHVLNASTEYAVMRNFEDLPESATTEEHGDVDLICASSREMAFVANASPAAPGQYRVLYRVTIGGKEVLFDFREVGDNYYDPQWEREMLERRVFSSRGFFHLGPDDYFHSLLYHATVHKPAVATGYLVRLRELSSGSFELSKAR